MIINIEFDTVNKTATAKLDGMAIDNFKAANVYKNYKDDYAIELVSGMEDEENEVHFMTRVCAEDGSLKVQDEDKKVVETTPKVKDDAFDVETAEELKKYYGIDDQ